MPVAASWNGKLRGTGNGGLGGGAGVNAGALANGVRLGYATAGNNTGHEGDSRYAIDHPEKIKDFGYRAAHEMTVASKALIKAFYDKASDLLGDRRGRRRHDRRAQLRAAIPRGLRCHRRHRHVVVPDPPHVRPDVVLAGDAPGRGELHPAGEISRCCTMPLSPRATRSTASRTGSSATCWRCKFDPVVTQCKSDGGPGCLTVAAG